MREHPVLIGLGYAFLLAGMLFMVRGLVEGKGTTPRGRDTRISRALFAISIAVFLAAAVLTMADDSWARG